MRISTKKIVYFPYKHIIIKTVGRGVGEFYFLNMVLIEFFYFFFPKKKNEVIFQINIYLYVAPISLYKI